MTRFLIAVLLVLNAATLAWQWDAFACWGYGPNTAREPERMSQQIRPDAIRVEAPAVPTPADTPASGDAETADAQSAATPNAPAPDRQAKPTP